MKLYSETQDDKQAADTAELVSIESASKKMSSPMTLKEYLANKNPDVIDLYNKLQALVLSGSEDTDLHVIPQYIGWRVNGIQFAEIHLQRNCLMMLTLQPRFETSLGAKVPDNFLWSLNYRTYLSDPSKIDEAAKIQKIPISRENSDNLLP